jgi:cytochrome P450
MGDSNQCPFDAFKKLREDSDVVSTEIAGESIELVLGYKAVRTAAKNWQHFSSNGKCKVPIPSEAEVRTVQQFPIEKDPPEHAEYRSIIEPFFRQPFKESYRLAVSDLIKRLVRQMKQLERAEIVEDFSLPLQSLALTYLLKLPESWAEEWIKWGTEIYLEGGETAKIKGNMVEDYITQALASANDPEASDIFNVLNRSKVQGRLLTDEEKLGTMILVFAGGRDTVINTTSSIIHYFASHPETLQSLDSDDKINIATEEFFRALSPLTQIGRWCPVDAELGDKKVAEGKRIGLSWAAANYDPNKFKLPETLDLTRKPNAHIAFGSGIHSCPGAHHARLIVRVLIKQLKEQQLRFEIETAVPRCEEHEDFSRLVGYKQLQVKISSNKG